MDYEEMMLQITDVLKANNRYRLGDFEQAVKLIREIVTPKGEWLDVKPVYPYPLKCSVCGHMNSHKPRYCSACGSLNNKGIKVWRGYEYD